MEKRQIKKNKTKITIKKLPNDQFSKNQRKIAPHLKQIAKQNERKSSNNLCLIQTNIQKEKQKYCKNKQKVSSLDSKSLRKNDLIWFRKTTPCLNNNSTAASNKNYNIKEKSKGKIREQSKQHQNEEKNKTLELKKMSLKNLKNQKKLEKNTFADQDTKNIKNRKQQRYFRKSTQTCINKSKSTSKGKSSKDFSKYQKLQNKKNYMQIKYPKSSFATCQISRNNSKQKQLNHKDHLNKKFKKKNNSSKSQTKTLLKKQNIYSSVRISQRNSTKIIEAHSNQFVFIDKSKNIDNVDKLTQKCKSNEIIPQKNFHKIKNLNFLEHFDSIEDKLKIIKNTNNYNQQYKNSKSNELDFSFHACIQKENTKNNQNIHEISIDRYLQNSFQQPSFHLQCEQVLKQRLSKIEQISLQKLKQQQFSSLDKIQSLNSFDNILQNQRKYSISSQICSLALKNIVDFRKITIFQTKNRFAQRINLIDWMSMLSSSLLLKNQTFQLAVCYFDIYSSQLQQRSINQPQQQSKLLCLGCLLIAIKMDQRQYQYDILNALTTLEIEFSRKQIIKTELQILKILKLKLKIQTLSFWIDYFSRKWDFFLSNDETFFQEKNKIFLRCIEGKSYQNYRRIIDIIDVVLLDGGIFQHQFVNIVLSLIYLVLQQTIKTAHKQRIFEQISNFKNNSHSQSRHSDQKNVLQLYATQQTLDQLQLNDSKQNKQSNFQVLKNEQNQFNNKSSIKKCYKKVPKDNNESLLKFEQIFNSFGKKYADRYSIDLEKSIQYCKGLLELKSTLEIDPRIYEQAQCYEQFIRYHNYSPYKKIFVLKKYEQQKMKNVRISAFNQISLIEQTKMESNSLHPINTCLQIANNWELRNLEVSSQNEQYYSKEDAQKNQNDCNLMCYLHQQLDQVFTNQQIGFLSNR